jgi:hypothetical protein
MRTPLFYFSAALLCCNDFVWKSQFHNALTGKISDFAGIALWVLFWEAWLPQRFRAHLYIMTALFFTWFKSPLSESFLQFLHLVRVVDYTDLWALLVLLPLYFLDKKTDIVTWQPTVAGSIFALFLFGATSPADRYDENFCYNIKSFGFNISTDSLKSRIRTKYPTQSSFDSVYVYIGIKPKDCEKGVSYRFEMRKITADSTNLRALNYTPLCGESYSANAACNAIDDTIIPSLR